MTEPQIQWGRFPSPWVASGGLQQFQPQDKASLAALRVYLAMACWTARQDFDETPGVFLSFAITYNVLQKNSHSDRSELLPALNFLQDKGLLKFGNGGRGTRNTYQLLGESSKGWAKVPESVIDKLECLNLKYTVVPVHTRREVLLDALKLYVLFLAFRDKRNNRAKISYDKICVLTGIRRRGVRTALSLLISLKLIHLENSQNLEHVGPNTYFIMGLAKFRPLQSYLHDQQREAV